MSILTDKFIDILAEEKSIDCAQYIVAPVPITLVNVLWPQMVPHLQRVVNVANGEISLQSIKTSLLLGQSMIMAICKNEEIVAVVTAEKRTFESGKSALFLPIVGGDELDCWMHQVLELSKLIAKDLGCDVIRGLGARKGWIRKLKDEGWIEAYSVLELNLE